MIELPDLSAIATDGMVWTTPAETRKELHAAIGRYSTTASGLVRTYPSLGPYQSFNNFLKASGEFGGSGNQCYHPAEAFVEQLRVVERRAKTKKRLHLEQEVSAGRLDRRTGGPDLGLDPQGKYWQFPGDSMQMDALGRYGIVRG